MTHTLFGHLAGRFVTQRENLATEGLAYILKRSATARAALIRLMADAGAALPADLTFHTQSAGDDQAIPDLVGEDQQGRQIVIGEVKFWAGLTAAQPVAYINRLHDLGGGVLVVIAPEMRLGLLWHEIDKRCRGAGIKLGERKQIGAGLFGGDLEPGGSMVMVSWRTLLSAVRSRVDAAGEDRVVADLVQLQGLCDQMDSEAFFPLTSEEMTGSTGRRVVQFNQLVDETFGRLANAGIADGSGMRSQAGSGWYGRYCRIVGIPALLHSNMWMWGSDALTPIWLRLMPPDWKSSSRVLGRALRPLEANGRIVLEGRAWHDIAIDLLTGVEREQVLTSIVVQVEAVVGLVRPLGLGSHGEVTPVEGKIAANEPIGMESDGEPAE